MAITVGLALEPSIKLMRYSTGDKLPVQKEGHVLCASYS